MTIHFFTKGDERLGDSRQRAFRIAEELNARGLKAVVHAPSLLQIANTSWPGKLRHLIDFTRALHSTKKGDLIFLQRTVGNKYVFLLLVVYLFFHARKIIFDFDDAIYLYDSFQTKTLVRMADQVIVCSQMLADWVRPYNEHVSVFHTVLKFSDYAAFTKDYTTTAGPTVIGWVGTAKNHMENLTFLAGVLRTLATTKVPFTFVLVGAGSYRPAYELFEKIPHLTVEFIDELDWAHPASVPREIQKFDIGVMPLVTNDEWNLARSSFKPLEYMACGVVSLSSPIGEILNVVHDGENGILADSEDEWVATLTRLSGDRKELARLGMTGQAWVRDNECYEAIMPRLITLINPLVDDTIHA